MTAVETPAAPLSDQSLALLFQYTMEAYKVFQKYAETLPNPMAAAMFKQFALDERENRDLIDIKTAGVTGNRVKVTLGSDMIFSEIMEGELSFREAAEFLVSRERTMQRKLRDLIGSAAPTDLALLLYFETVKRAHVVELERELELIRHDRDWWKREDAQWRIVHGVTPE